MMMNNLAYTIYVCIYIELHEHVLVRCGFKPLGVSCGLGNIESFEPSAGVSRHRVGDLEVTLDTSYNYLILRSLGGNTSYGC
jgi:hypothetical protein